jgi:hypothetical protein
MFACQDDFNFESEDSEFVSTYEIRPKGDLGFKTKGKTRIVPLTLRLARAQPPNPPEPYQDWEVVAMEKQQQATGIGYYVQLKCGNHWCKVSISHADRHSARITAEELEAIDHNALQPSVVIPIA